MSKQKQTPGEVFCKKSVLRNFVQFIGKHLCQSFFNKVTGRRAATLLKKRLWQSCFPVSFPKVLRTPFSHKTPRGWGDIWNAFWNGCSECVLIFETSSCFTELIKEPHILSPSKLIMQDSKSFKHYFRRIVFNYKNSV